MKPQVDLRQLAFTREMPQPPAAVPSIRRRHLLTRMVLPGLLLVGFLAVMGWAVRDTLSPPRAVTVIPVLTAQTALDAPADTPLFRAAGWVEPRPTPTLITALAEGVVEQLLVVEGQQVSRGQVVARLISTDARLAVESAEAEVELRESEVNAASATLAAARSRLELPVHLQADLAEAETALARAESELAILPSSLASAETRLAFARREYDSQRRSGAGVPALSVEKARSDVDTATSSVRELQMRHKRLPIEIKALTARHESHKQKLARKVDEIRAVAESEAGVKSAQARLRQSRATRDMARLRLERMEICAPVAGRVLGLIARPGTRLNGMTASSLQDSSTILTMYDPSSLQARVDVRLEDVGKVRPGQKVRLECAALPQAPLVGEVLLATSQADIQKNTLSVKVAILAPPANLRPDMLCQVTFLALPRPAGKGETFRMLVPKQLLEGSTVWVVDQATGTAHVRTIEVGLSAGDLVEVTSGLAGQDRLIVGGRDGLREGMRVRVVGEDETLGLSK